MPQNYAGRVTLILVVLFLGLFGIPKLTDGIFSIEKFFNPRVGFNEKVNLKPGIDIAGGTSLLYEIKPPPGGFHDTSGTPLAEQVAALLKKRVDPQGVRNLIWRPQGDTRLEIQLPRSSMSKEGAGKVKQDYQALRDRIDTYNLSSAQVLAAVENLKGDERAKALANLAKGNKQREALFAQLTAHYDKLKDLDAKLDQAKKSNDKNVDQLALDRAEVKAAYDDAKARIEQSNMSVDDLESLVASDSPDKNKELAALKDRFPERKELIDQFAQLYPKYTASKSAIDDAADLKRLLRGSGVLEFHILVDNPRVEQPEMVKRLDPGGEGPAPQAGDQSRWFIVDKPETFGRRESIFAWRDKSYALAWTTPEKSMVHGESGKDWGLQHSALQRDQQTSKWIVTFEFDPVGGAFFSKLTGANINKPLATVLDNKIITAPNIRSQIGDRGQIDLGSDNAEAEGNYIASTLNAGSLPAQLADEPISEREVGPQLGEANLRAGLFSCVAGLIVVGIFLFFYYHLSGLVALAALIFNLIIILGILGMMGATFTLPGIAGLVLTIGVSVDANVLIFERLREEQMRGLSLKLAIRNAYDRAFTAILDSNVTTAITSAFLIYFGSEEVKGFGLTLLIGILASMFSALFVTKTIFGIMIEKYGLRDLGSFPRSFPAWNKLMHPKIDWMGKVPYFLAFSTLFVVLGLTALVQQGRQGKVLDVEFASGTEVQFTTKAPMSDSQVRERIGKRPDEVPQPSVVAVGEQFEKDKYKTFSVVTANADRKQVSDAVFAVMNDVLDVAVPSRFDHFNAPVDQAVKAGAIQPIVMKNNQFRINGEVIADAPAGGAAIVLSNIDPPLPPGEIYNRVSRAQLGASGAEAEAVQRVQVVRLDGNAHADAPTRTAAVLVSNKNFDYSKNEADWREKLAGPAWKLVNEGIGREASLQKVSNFDPQVAGDTQRAAIFATLGSIVAIMIWIWLRFGDMKYGTATVVAMIHDTVMVVGAIGLSHWLANTLVGRGLAVEAFRLNMTIVAAVLTVMGYSMVDTIVVFDRIRENRGKYGTITRQLINDSVNQTLSRTLLTAGSTLMTLFVMYVWGGPAIHGFTFILLIGILIGTYSSIAIAAPILLIGAKQPAAGQKQQQKPSGAKATSAVASAGTPVGAVHKAGA
ncbi:MAG TPA: protein translocase subunit SecD [Tepidisphaeraceae bacterium]|jgi:SecD/SecF fusion protein